MKTAAKIRLPATRCASTCLGLVLLLSGCSSFDREWRRAAAPAPPADALTGRWEGLWVSAVNGHHGRLRCLITARTNELYSAWFRATYLRILHFSYTVPLHVAASGSTWQFHGAEDLGGAAGGVYRYAGQATPTNFHSTYDSRYDHGVFEMTRPAK